MIWWAVFLFLAGVVLVMAEFIVPGAICGAFGGILLVTSCVIACRAYPDYTFFIVAGELISIVLLVVAGLRLFPKTPFGKALILKDSQEADAGWVAWKTDESLLGKTGVVYSSLRPAGAILVDGKRIDAVSDGQFIDKDARVRVIEVRGSRVVVEALHADSAREN